MMTDEALLAAKDGSGREAFGETDRMLKLWELLGRQAGKYCGMDSTSTSTETARRLLQSLMFTISLVCEAENKTENEIYSEELSQVLSRGQSILRARLEKGKLLWQKVKLTAPKIRNPYYDDTLRETGEFFRRYDLYYFAHDIPCSIDYPLMHTFDEGLEGLRYIEGYLSSLLAENRLLSKFSPDLVQRLYAAVLPEHKDSYFNLAEYVFVNAMGLTVSGGNILTLDMDDERREILNDILSERSTEECKEIFTSAAGRLCCRLNIEGEFDTGYFSACAQDLAVRTREIVRKGELSGLYVSLLPEGISRAGF